MRAAIAFPVLSNFKTLYGGNPESGSRGTVFAISNAGLDYQTLHEFTGGTTDGAMSAINDGFLVLGGSTLYGTTSYGGAAEAGALFSITIPAGDISGIFPLIIR